MARVKLEDVQRSADFLRGFLQGLSFDRELSARELEALESWLASIQELHGEPPFSELVAKLRRIEQDRVLEVAERDEMLEWCDLFQNGSPLAQSIDAATARLQGVLKGVAADGVIEDEEVEMLQEWLEDHDRHRERWPFSVVWEQLERVCADGQIDETERDDLLWFCMGIL